MVTIVLPAARVAGVLHDRIGTEFMSTVHAPHWPMPHPYLVPVSFSVSRITQSSGVSGETDTSCVVPFTFSVMKQILVSCPLRDETLGGTFGKCLSIFLR